MDEKEFEDLLEFSKKFSEKKKEEEEDLPYHINVIDELHINENGHSRVLTKLLQYKNEKKEYVILRSLLDRISKQVPEFKQIQVESPNITQETARIDLWVQEENKYAIIFENKIYNAADQDAQICRYIEKTKEQKYKEEQIFVIYLSRDGKEPEEQSWGSYKESFKSRYMNLSFRYDILPWLKNDVIPNVRQKDIYLLSALQQYVFFLEGDKMFRTGEIYKNMNMELNKEIERHYLLTKDDLSKLLDLKKDFQKNSSEVMNGMEELTKEYFKALYEKWFYKIKQKFNLETELFLDNNIWEIIKVHINGFEISISGGTKDHIDKNFYYGVGLGVTYENKEKLKEVLGLEGENGNSIFNSLPLDDYKDGYEKVYDSFEKLVEKVIEFSKK